jgi:hypothetical protein
MRIQIRDPGSEICLTLDRGWKKFGSGSATLIILYTEQSPAPQKKTTLFCTRSWEWMLWVRVRRWWSARRPYTRLSGSAAPYTSSRSTTGRRGSGTRTPLLRYYNIVSEYRLIWPPFSFLFDTAHHRVHILL